VRQVHRRRARHASGFALVLAVVVAAGCEPVPPPPPPPPVRAVIVGDSLTNDMARQLAEQAPGRSISLTVRPMAGNALCGMLDIIVAEAARKPEVLVVESAGNANEMTPCALVDGAIPTGQDYLDRYRVALTEVVAAIHLESPTTKVVVTGIPPLLPPDQASLLGLHAESPMTQWAADGLNAIYQESADLLGYRYVDAGRSLTGADGAWVATLPCEAMEPCVGNEIDPSRAAPGTNLIRSPDMLHLCPVQLQTAAETCPVHSSGGRRLATATLDAIVLAATEPAPTTTTTSSTSTNSTTTTTTTTSSTTTTTTTTPDTTTTSATTTSTTPDTTTSTTTPLS
jgi:hypothetical protein